MVGREVTPTDIGKHSKLIRAAQEEMATMDVLVCGRCLNVFHFIEEFRQHKQKPCHKETNNVRECNDTKPKIWAFLLWKATQLNNNKETNSVSPNSWSLYQTWVKMDESIRETWIVAGKTIQSFAKLGQGGLQEMPVKITKTVVNNNPDGLATSPGRKPLTQSKPIITNLKPPVKLPVNTKSQDSDTETSPTKVTGGGNVGNLLPKIIKKPIVAVGNAVGNKITPNTPIQKTQALSRRAKRTVPNSNEITEETVEKIVAKRFNPVRKMHEYLVKWEGRTHEQNTWERAVHLDNVPHLLDTFEKQLARQRETRAALQAKQAANVASAIKTVDPNKKDTTSGKAIITATQKLPTLNTDMHSDAASKSNLASPAGSDSSRLARTSKTKAMDQVKQWCATGSTGASSPSFSQTGDATVNNASLQDDKDWSMNTSNSSVGGGGVKRKLDDSDFNDSAEASDVPSTTATMEDLEEDLIPSHTMKRMKNGNSVSVEVKTKTEKNVESKLIKVNGTSTRSSSISGESGITKSAEVIITQDTSASGVVKKPGFNGSSSNSNSQKTEAQIRVLSKGESAVSNTGIVRLSGGQSTENLSSNTSISTSEPLAQTKVVPPSRPQQIRVGGGHQTSTQQLSSIGSTQITTVTQRTQMAGPQRTPSGTTIQRKPIASNAIGGGSNLTQRTSAMQSQARTTTLPQRTTISAGSNQTSPSSGRMIIPRNGATASARPTVNSKNVTPEQKILQLSKSGDLKVTKKVMTREDAAAHRSQQARQQQLQRQQQQQSQVQIQKVQQIAPPSARSNTTVSVRKSQTEYEDGDTQATLCPITGKILGQDDQNDQLLVQQQQQLQSGVLQTQLLTDQQQQMAMQQQQDLNEIDPTLLLTNDQQMLTNEDGSPLLVTGEDGTVYQVAGKNAEGQTILVTQGPDGEQQFAYVAAAEGEENPVLTLDTAVAEAVAQMPPDQQAEALAAASGEGGQYLVKTTQEDGTTSVVTMSEAELAQHQATALAQQQQQQQQQVSANTGPTGQLCIQTGDGSDGQEANIPAEVVQADLPSPGGTRRVVLLLQDGTFMMTEMHDDEFKALNIAA